MSSEMIIQLNEKSRRMKFTAGDILTWPLIGPFLRWRYSRRVMQTVLLLATSVFVFDGLVGPVQAPKNLATVSAWVHYRGLVVLALLVAGNLFCMACPFMLPREMGRWLGAKWGLQGNVPKFLRNKWLAALLLIIFFISYEYWDLWASPWLTAWILISYFLTALVVDTFFKGAAFCKYVCPLGQFNFFGSLSSPTEIKIRDAKTCVACHTKDCIAGNRQTGQRGCELWLFQEKKSGNMDCTFCLDCVYACPHDNIGWQARLPLQELWIDPRRAGIGRFSQRWDLTALMVVLITAAYLNAFGMITPVYALQQMISDALNATSELPSLLVIFGVGFLILPVIVLAVTGYFSRLLSGRSGEPLGQVIRRFVYALAPLGFGVWLAHYAFHFLTGGLTIIPVVQSFLNDVGVSAGQPQWQLGQVVPADWLFPLQTIFLYLGVFSSLVVGFQIALHQYKDRHVALRAFIPWAILAILLLLAAFWIMLQPMEMRGTLFIGL